MNNNITDHNPRMVFFLGPNNDGEIEARPQSVEKLADRNLKTQYDRFVGALLGQATATLTEPIENYYDFWKEFFVALDPSGFKTGRTSKFLSGSQLFRSLQSLFTKHLHTDGESLRGSILGYFTDNEPKSLLLENGGINTLGEKLSGFVANHNSETGTSAIDPKVKCDARPKLFNGTEGPGIHPERIGFLSGLVSALANYTEKSQASA